MEMDELVEHWTVLYDDGAGSFCSAPPGAERTRTVGEQKRTNTLLGAADEDAFVAQLLGSLGSYPAYFDRLAEVNRRGPVLMGVSPVVPALTPAQVRRLAADGAQVVDVRPAADFAAGHIPGALHTELGSLPDTAAVAPDGAMVMSGHGERAMTAASVLARAGRTGLAVPDGGPGDWTRVTGRALEDGA